MNIIGDNGNASGKSLRHLTLTLVTVVWTFTQINSCWILITYCILNHAVRNVFTYFPTSPVFVKYGNIIKITFANYWVCIDNDVIHCLEGYCREYYYPLEIFNNAYILNVIGWITLRLRVLQILMFNACQYNCVSSNSELHNLYYNDTRALGLFKSLQF